MQAHIPTPWPKGVITDDRNTFDWLLGIGGLGLAVVSFASLPFRIEINGDPESVNSIFGVLMLLWMTAITIRHLGGYPKGGGRGWLTAAWAIFGLFVAWAIFQSVDTAAFDDGVLDGFAELAASPPRLVLILPLVFASVAILQDRRHSQGSPVDDGVS